MASRLAGLHKNPTKITKYYITKQLHHEFVNCILWKSKNNYSQKYPQGNENLKKN